VTQFEKQPQPTGNFAGRPDSLSIRLCRPI
jgi:hypothetical protein